MYGTFTVHVRYMYAVSLAYFNGAARSYDIAQSFLQVIDRTEATNVEDLRTSQCWSELEYSLNAYRCLPVHLTEHRLGKEIKAS